MPLCANSIIALQWFQQGVGEQLANLLRPFQTCFILIQQLMTIVATNIIVCAPGGTRSEHGATILMKMKNRQRKRDWYSMWHVLFVIFCSDPADVQEWNNRMQAGDSIDDVLKDIDTKKYPLYVFVVVVILQIKSNR